MSTGPIKKNLLRLVEFKTPPLPGGVRRDAGYHLNRIQDGESLGMPISRPMPSIGPRVTSCGCPTSPATGG